MTEKLMENAPTEGREKVQALARMIATEPPQLEDLTEEQLQRLAQVVVAETLKDDLRRRADQERIDYPAERERFIERSSPTGSQHTKDLYRRALRRLVRRAGNQPPDSDPCQGRRLDRRPEGPEKGERHGQRGRFRGKRLLDVDGAPAC